MSLVLAFIAAVGGSSSYAREARLAHLQGLLEAVRDTDPKALRQLRDYAAALERSSCSGREERLRAACLMTAARRHCRGKGRGAASCPIVADAAVAAVLGERQILPSEERYAILARPKDHRGELARVVQRRIGSMAVEFQTTRGRACAPSRLAVQPRAKLTEEGRSANRDEPGPELGEPRCLSEQIDTYCLATGDEHGVSWQTCAASLVWFIGAAR